ncbi:hypothetical protein [Papillibacter cinnamivorans]|uniref:Uncharacterized protein n=1 Tax=Papillibacter cinnamivorans DSM 12816 TaxID=1122930 RepID=A0A1W1YPY4_9FIRM|nr:hypothetical protein [Papillibacter cinnamivorans]SMC38203.1 hypothetical protein SAMN02745168_0605 [Papillibacter cinnamivorans DSM 12816]
MLKEAIEKIVSLAETQTYSIDGQVYSDKTLVRIPPHVDAPKSIDVTTLESIVRLIKAEILKVNQVPIFVRVTDYNSVCVFTTYRGDFARDYLYKAVSDTPAMRTGWKDYETAMISLRSQFVATQDLEYVLELLSTITDENSVKTEDNGLTQTVQARKGISLAMKTQIRPLVKLRPFRTFLEVEQPESEFLLRLQEGGQVGLFEADGGMWQLAAKRSIKSYFEDELKDLIEAGSVVVTV